MCFIFFTSFEEEISKLHTALGVAKDEATATMKLFNKGEVEKLKKDKEKYKQEVAHLKQVSISYRFGNFAGILANSHILFVVLRKKKC